MRAIAPCRSDAAVEVRNRAIAAAGSLGDREAVPSLITASETPASRFEASLALAALPDIRALAGLPSRIDRQEHRLAEGFGGGDREHSRSGGRRARSARGPPRAAAGSDA